MQDCLRTLLYNHFYFVLAEIRKVLSKIAKTKGCEELAAWIKPCERHLHRSATSTFSGNGRVIWAKFKAFMNHVVNKHNNFEDPLFNKCAHGNLEPRKWLRIGNVVVKFFLFMPLIISVTLFSNIQKKNTVWLL